MSHVDRASLRVCFHPHGVLPLGFSFNAPPGKIDFDRASLSFELPRSKHQGLSVSRHNSRRFTCRSHSISRRSPESEPDPAIRLSSKDCDGVQAPVLWRLPFFAPMLRMWDCCTPATKAERCRRV